MRIIDALDGKPLVNLFNRVISQYSWCHEFYERTSFTQRPGQLQRLAFSTAQAGEPTVDCKQQTQTIQRVL